MRGFRSLLLGLACLAGVTSAWGGTATTFYVAPTGKNTNNGSQAAPFATVAHACTVVKPGGTIVIRGGTYDFVVGEGGNFGCASGTSWHAPITIRSASGENVTWRRKPGSTPGKFPGFLTGSSRTGDSWNNPRYIRLIGEDRTDTPDPTDRRWVWDEFALSGHGSHIYVESIEIQRCICTAGIEGGNHWQLINLSVHDNGSASLSHGLYSQMSDSLFKGGHWFNNSGYNIHLYFNTSTHACVAGKRKEFTGNPPTDGCGVINNVIDGVETWNTRIPGRGSGIVLRPGYHNTIMNSIIRNNNGKPGLYLAGGEGNNILNNTIYNNFTRVGGHRHIFRNNLLWESGGGKHFDIIGGTHTFDHNLEISTAAPSPAVVVNASAGNFHLVKGSPAINAGAAVAGVVTTDKDRASRPVGGAWDVGAYEFGGTVAAPGGDTTAPSAPTNPTAHRHPE